MHKIEEICSQNAVRGFAGSDGQACKSPEIYYPSPGVVSTRNVEISVLLKRFD
jgi:hypothetical protein